MNHQDWLPTIITKPVPKKKKLFNTPEKTHYDEDGQEITKLKTIDDKQMYISMRQALNITRLQIAQMLSVKVGVINDIENGKIVDKNLAGKYKNLLKRKIKIDVCK